MEIIVLALPSVIGFIFAAILYQRKFHTLAEKFMLAFLAVISTFLFLDGYTVYPLAYSPAKVLCLIANALFGSSIGITICFVSWSLFTVRQRFRKFFLCFYTFSLVVFILELLNYIGFGLDRAADYFEHDRMYPAECATDTFLYHIYGTFEFVAVYVYNLVCIVGFVISLVYLVTFSVMTDFGPKTLFNFLFRRGPLRVGHVWMLTILNLYVFAAVRIYYGSHGLIKDPDAAILLYVYAAISVMLMGWVALNLRKPCIYLVRPHRQPQYDDLPVTIFSIDDYQVMDDDNVSSWDMDVEADTYRTLNARKNLLRLMRDQTCYLYPGLSRYYVAEMLGLRRDSLDRTMHILFHISYEEYVMVQRIEYCRRYRDRYTNESEQTISIACGFSSLKEMQYEWRECRVFFRRADQLLAEEKQRRKAGLSTDV